MSAPKTLQELVSVCLAKDTDERWQSMRDVLLQLRSIALTPRENVMPPSVTRPWRWSGIAITAGIAVLSALAGWLVRPYEHVQAYQVSINPPDGSAFGGSAISPDGKQLAFVVRKDGKAQLWVRQLDSPTARSLSGTEDASDPFWSPDSRYVGFFTREKLKRIEVAQGPPQTLCDAVSGRGGSWNARGDIVFAAFSTGRALRRIAASGGASAPVTSLDTALGDVFHYWPHFLPDGRHYLYFVRTAKAETTGIRVGTLDAPLPRADRLLISTISNAAYAGPGQPSWLGKGAGHLLFLSDRALLAQAFDPAELEVKGDPFQIAEDVGYARTTGRGDFSVSSHGTLAYGSTSGLKSQLLWRDRSGKQLGILETGSDFRLRASRQTESDWRSPALTPFRGTRTSGWGKSTAPPRADSLIIQALMAIPRGRPMAVRSHSHPRRPAYTTSTARARMVQESLNVWPRALFCSTTPIGPAMGDSWSSRRMEGKPARI